MNERNIKFLIRRYRQIPVVGNKSNLLSLSSLSSLSATQHLKTDFLLGPIKPLPVLWFPKYYLLFRAPQSVKVSLEGIL